MASAAKKGEFSVSDSDENEFSMDATPAPALAPGCSLVVRHHSESEAWSLRQSKRRANSESSDSSYASECCVRAFETVWHGISGRDGQAALWRGAKMLAGVAPESWAATMMPWVAVFGCEDGAAIVHDIADCR